MPPMPKTPSLSFNMMRKWLQLGWRRDQRGLVVAPVLTEAAAFDVTLGVAAAD